MYCCFRWIINLYTLIFFISPRICGRRQELGKTYGAPLSSYHQNGLANIQGKKTGVWSPNVATSTLRALNRRHCMPCLPHVTRKPSEFLLLWISCLSRAPSTDRGNFALLLAELLLREPESPSTEHLLEADVFQVSLLLAEEDDDLPPLSPSICFASSSSGRGAAFAARLALPRTIAPVVVFSSPLSTSTPRARCWRVGV